MKGRTRVRQGQKNLPSYHISHSVRKTCDGFSYNELAFTAFLWRCSLNSVRLLLVQGNCSNAADAMTASVGLTNAAADDGTATGVEGGGGRSEGGGGEGGGGTGGGGECGGGGGYGTQLLAMLLKPPPV